MPSMQLCVENVDQAGGCFYGYSCAYTDSISWATTEDPLPMIRDPRAVFDQLFGIGATPEARAARRRRDRSILDWVTQSTNQLKRTLGAADQVAARPITSKTCARSSAASRRWKRRTRRAKRARFPGAPIGVPDSYDEHVKLMFDMQVVAFASDVTRVVAFKLSRDVSNRVYPETGVNTGFHIASHHGEREERILDLAKINKYHVGLVPYFLKKLKETPDGDSNLLENSLLIYGSPMGNSNVHNHKRCPLFLAGHAGGALKGNLHIKAADGTPMANAMLGALRGVGLELDTFGDSNAVMDLEQRLRKRQSRIVRGGGSLDPAMERI